jgi:hypothetical protein
MPIMPDEEGGDSAALVPRTATSLDRRDSIAALEARLSDVPTADIPIITAALADETKRKEWEKEQEHRRSLETRVVEARVRAAEKQQNYKMWTGNGIFVTGLGLLVLTPFTVPALICMGTSIALVAPNYANAVIRALGGGGDDAKQ